MGIRYTGLGGRTTFPFKMQSPNCEIGGVSVARDEYIGLPRCGSSLGTYATAAGVRHCARKLASRPARTADVPPPEGYDAGARYV